MPAPSGQSIGANQLILGDCLRILAEPCFPTVDLVHTSPPYNIDKPYKGYSDNHGLPGYLHLIDQVAELLARRIKPGGSLFWQTGYTGAGSGSGQIVPIDVLTFPIFQRHGFYLKDRIIWRYYGGMSFKTKFKNQHETIFWYVRGDPRANPPYCFDVDAVREGSRQYDPRNNLLGRNPGNVWEQDRVAFGSTGQTSHIAVFPEEVSERIVRACTRPGDLVLDPFLGSGTVAAVARSLGRRYIGIEVSKEYLAEATHRVGLRQFGEVDTVLAELLACGVRTADFARARPRRPSSGWSKPRRLSLPAGSSTNGKSRRCGRWGMSSWPSLPEAPSLGFGLVANVTIAYRRAYRLARRFNGLRLAVLAVPLARQVLERNR